jgi:hypothetical protein
LVLLAMLSSMGGWTSCDDGGTASSKSLATREITTSIDATSRAPGLTVVSATLELERENGTTPIRLNGGESFVATFQGRRQRLRSNGPGYAVPEYETVFETPVAEGLVSVRFRRNNYADVNDLEVELPQELRVTEPVRGQVLTYTDVLPLTWSPGEAGQVIEIWIRIGCYAVDSNRILRRSFRLRVDDDGVHDYDLSQLPEATHPSVDRARGCGMSVDFGRSRSNDLSPPFASGSRIVATQRRVISDIRLVE